MARRHFALWLVPALAVGFASNTTFAQGRPGYGAGPAPQQQLQKEEFSGKGEFEAAGSAGLKAVLDGKPWVIQFDPKVRVNVNGTATADALMPGMFVKFRAEVDKKGKVSEEIGDLEICTPNEKNPPGATPAGGSPFDSGPAKKGTAATPASYDIAGKIISIKKGAITVACPGLTVHGQLSSDPTITVNAADLRFASPGDKISVKGWHVKGQDGKGYASEIEVQMANALSAPGRKGAHAAKSAEKPSDSGTAPSGDKKSTKTGANAADPKGADAKAADPKAAAKNGDSDAK